MTTHQPAASAPGSTRGATERPARRIETIVAGAAAAAEPALRAVVARAAEFAAQAGEAAGPMAYRAAEATEGLGRRLAERSRGLAVDLRRGPATMSTTGAEGPAAVQPYVGPGTPPGDPGTQSWADTRAGSLVEPLPATSPAERFLEEPGIQ